MADKAIRKKLNPLLSPKDLKANNEHMIIECLLNPGVFEFNGKIGLLVGVAERTIQKEGMLHVPIYNNHGKIEISDFNLIHFINGYFIICNRKIKRSIGS